MSHRMLSSRCYQPLAEGSDWDSIVRLCGANSSYVRPLDGSQILSGTLCTESDCGKDSLRPLPHPSLYDEL